jgi:thioredoxin reductase (NADPH)
VEKRELAIIGGGPAGLAAGLYAARAGLDVVLIEKGDAWRNDDHYRAH